MRTKSFLLLSWVVAVTAAGCNKDAPPVAQNQPSPGAVAVIDLDEIARQLGRDTEMTTALKQRQASLNQQLSEIQVKYREEITKKKEALGDQPTEEQTKEFVTLNQRANAQFNQVINQAKTNLNNHRAQLISDFREDAKPVAQQVAKEKGLSVVITKNDSVVFSYETAVDITDEVVQQMKTSGGARIAQQPASGEQIR